MRQMCKISQQMDMDLLEQAEPKDISDDDEEVAKVVDQFVIQNTYTEPVGSDDDDSVEAALQPLHWVCNYL